MTELNSQFAAELRLIQDRIDTHNAQIRDLSAQQKTLSEQIDRVHGTLRTRQDRKQKLQNLRRAVGEMRERLAGRVNAPPSGKVEIGEADKEFAITMPEAATNGDSLQSPQPVQSPTGLNLPPPAVLQARLQAYNKFNARLSAHLSTLKARDIELEAKYRKVIALCTNVEEGHVDQLLNQLVMAVESEGDQGSDVGRVREFLRRVEGHV
jgi:regulatory protein SWI6